MNPVKNSWHWISEQAQSVADTVFGIVPAWGMFSWRGLRSLFQVRAARFWGTTPAFDHTIVNFDLARQLYRNDGAKSALGGGFAKPIIDLTVDFMGVPSASTDDENLTDFLNDCLHDYWGGEIKQVFRNCIRDSKVIIRLRQPDIADPLVSMAERQYGCLETVDPERVVLQYSPSNKDVIDVAYITTRRLIVHDTGDIINGIMPQEREHEIMEIIDNERFQYFDKTERRFMPELEQPNTFGIVPLVEVYNEYESYLSGGQSDLESVYPFIMAAHDVLSQSLQAHAYHSTPKIKFQLHEVSQFLRNNFPDAFDSTTGQIKPNSTISWDKNSVIFLEADEDAGFIEAKSVLNDSRELAEFLIDCICVASETPKWAFMLIDSGSANQANNAQTLPFLKKIDRKRIQFAKPLQRVLKMIQHVNGEAVVLPTITWDSQHPETLATWAQAFQFLVMSLEVMAQRQIISDKTYREVVANYIPQMESPSQEATDAAKNYDALIAQAEAQAKNAPPSPAPNGKGKPQNVPTPISSGQQGKGE